MATFVAVATVAVVTAVAALSFSLAQLSSARQTLLVQNINHEDKGGRFGDSLPWMSNADVSTLEEDFALAEAAAAITDDISSEEPRPVTFLASLASMPTHLLPLSVAPPQSWVVEGRNRRPSAPLVTGDGFRAAADMRCEPPDNECMQVDAAGWAAARPGVAAVIFVKQDHVGAFFSSALPRLRAVGVCFVLVSHNSDASAPARKEDARWLDDEPLLLAWFAQNPSCTHSKLRALPIGFENRYNAFGRSPETLLRGRAAAAASLPQRLLLAAFSTATNPGVRGPLSVAAAELFGTNLTTGAGIAPGQEAWYTAIADHRLVLCPAGHGLDTHRTWETLYLGRVPVVERSAIDQLFAHLPVIVLDSWAELSAAKLERDLAIIERRRTVTGEFHGGGMRLRTYVCRIFFAAGRRHEITGSCPDESRVA
jgi:hypothetical protein